MTVAVVQIYTKEEREEGVDLLVTAAVDTIASLNAEIANKTNNIYHISHHQQQQQQQQYSINPLYSFISYI